MTLAPQANMSYMWTKLLPFNWWLLGKLPKDPSVTYHGSPSDVVEVMVEKVNIGNDVFLVPTNKVIVVEWTFQNFIT